MSFIDHSLKQLPTPVLIMQGPPEFRVVAANDKYLQIMGTTEESVLMRSALELVPEADRAKREMLLQAVFETGQQHWLKEVPVSYEQQGTQKTEVHQVLYAPQRDASGQITGVIALGYDVSELVNARNELAQKEEFIRTTLESSPDCIKILDSEGRLHYMNFNGICQMEIDDFRLVQDKFWWELWPEKSKLEVRASVSQALEGKTARFQAFCPTAKGQPRWWDVLVAPVISPQGQITQILSVSRNITDQKKAEASIRESEQRYRTTFDYAALGIAHVDAEGNLRKVNQRFADITGYTRSELEQMRFQQLTHPEDVDADEQLLLALMRGNIPSYMLEKRYYCKNGELVWVNLTVGMVRKEDGTPDYFISMVEDITQRKNDEERIRDSEIRYRKLAEHLELLIAERTQELAQANQELERSNEDLQQFAHVASHDLKEPVRKIKTFTSRLQQELNDHTSDSAKLYLDKVQSAANRMITMIDGVLNYSTIQERRNPKEPVNLTEVLQHIEQDLEVLLRQKGAEIRYDTLPTLHSDPFLMYQLLYNLVNNSMKFARDGVPPEVSIHWKPVQHEGKSFAHLTLSDNGIGFEQQYAESIFGTFTRLHSKDQYEGTGLGLALCKKIVERQGGFIRAQGEKNKGATFSILLPLEN